MREAGAIEATGHKLIIVPPVNGKLKTEAIEAALASNVHFPHMAKPRMIYLSNASETGATYTLAHPSRSTQMPWRRSSRKASCLLATNCPQRQKQTNCSRCSRIPSSRPCNSTLLSTCGARLTTIAR
nr:hypothetical protein [Comamonas sp. 26]